MSIRKKSREEAYLRNFEHGSANPGRKGGSRFLRLKRLDYDRNTRKSQ
jgi:hypothetical protein